MQTLLSSVSLLGSTFYFCQSWYEFNQFAFLDGSFNINNTISQNYFRSLDEHHMHIAQFMKETTALRDSICTFGISLLY